MPPKINSLPGGYEGDLYNSKNWIEEAYSLGSLDNATVAGEYKRTNIKGPELKQNFSTKLNWTLGQNGPSQKDINKRVNQIKFQNVKDGIKNFGNKLGNAIGSEGGMTLANGALNIASGFVKTQAEKGKNPTGYETQQAIGDTLTKFPNPIVKAAGVAYKGISMLAEATGGNTNSITKEQADDIGVSKGARALNNIIGTLAPGAGWLTDKVEEGQKSHLIDEMSNAYADTVADIDQAGVLGGGKYLFGKKKIEGAVAEANRRNELLTEMNMTNTMRKQSDYGRDLAQQNMNRYAGTNYMDMRMGRKGMKIQSLEEIRELLKNRVVEELDVQKFAEGGSILPTGKLHKELNHMQELGEQFEDLTRKGIPVVTMDESGDMIQVAEIEHSEIILSKEITDQLESFWKDGSEEAMIAAGKLLAEEILYNMKDEGGILDGDNESKS